MVILTFSFLQCLVLTEGSRRWLNGRKTSLGQGMAYMWKALHVCLLECISRANCLAESLLKMFCAWEVQIFFFKLLTSTLKKIYVKHIYLLISHGFAVVLHWFPCILWGSIAPVLPSALDHCLTEVLIFSLLSPHPPSQPPELPQIKGEFCFIFKFGVY